MALSAEILLFLVAGLVIVYALLSNLLGRTVLTLPILFVGIGFVISESVSSLGSVTELRKIARILAEITLILILFSDASQVRFTRLKHSLVIPLRMLVVGMPLAIAFGTLFVYWLFPATGLAMAILTAAVLTPTDAALAKSVVSSPEVPETLGQTINVESGLNDGLALPFVLLGAMLVSASMGSVGTEGLAFMSIVQVLLGPLVGIAVGWSVAVALDRASSRRWITESAQGIVFIAAAFLSFLASELVGGNGFVSAFVAGVVFGNVYRHDLHFVSEFMEGVGQLLTMGAFLVFGALMLPDGLKHASAATLTLSIGFLTVVRILPIWLSLIGSGMGTKEKLFVGWFGPRGLASILFTLIVIDEFDFPNEEELLACVSLTVALSVLLHGLTSVPFSKYLARG